MGVVHSTCKTTMSIDCTSETILSIYLAGFIHHAPSPVDILHVESSHAFRMDTSSRFLEYKHQSAGHLGTLSRCCPTRLLALILFCTFLLISWCAFCTVFGFASYASLYLYVVPLYLANGITFRCSICPSRCDLKIYLVCVTVSLRCTFVRD